MDDQLTFEEPNSVAQRDILTLVLQHIWLFLILLLPFIDPPGQKAASAAPPPGDVTVEVFWGDNIQADVDLWVQAPGDMPVGYSNKGGLVFNLLRDDLGAYMDATQRNFEVSYTRGLIPGDYTVNLHLYRARHADLPIHCRVVVSTRSDPESSAKQILLSEVDLRREGQELTVFRFKLAKHGELVPGSVYAVHKPLREMGSK